MINKKQDEIAKSKVEKLRQWLQWKELRLALTFSLINNLLETPFVEILLIVHSQSKLPKALPFSCS